MNDLKSVDPVRETSPGPSVHKRTTRLDAFARKVLSFPALMGALLVGAAVFSARMNLPDPDMWWHALVGQHILATHTWPHADFYSFTAPGAPWMAYEWLGEVVMALATHFGFFQGLTGLLMLLGAIYMALLYGYASLFSGNSKAALVACAIFLPFLIVFFTPRPQLIGYVFLVITLICLERYRQGKQKSLWILPPLFLIWLNAHGSFVFGLTVLGIYWVSGWFDFEVGGIRAEPWTSGQRRHLALVFLLCVIALTISPYGTRQAAYPLQMAFAEPVNVAHISEWQSLDFQIWQMKFLLIVVVLFWLSHIPLRQTYRLESVALLLLATYACFVHRRFIPFLVLILSPLIAKMLARWIPKYRPEIDKPVANAFLMGLVVFVLVITFPSYQKLAEAVADRYPVKAVEYLRENPHPGHMLNEYAWGGYLIWSPDLHKKVFVDGRADFYEFAGVLEDYLSMSDVRPETLFLLRKYDIDLCLIHQDAPLATMLSATPGWKEVYQDKLSAIFVKQPEQSPGSSSALNVPISDSAGVHSRAVAVPSPGRHPSKEAAMGNGS